MEIESITKQYTHETPYTIQRQFQYFKVSPSQLKSKLFTAALFSFSSQTHSSLESQQGASEIRYQTFCKKQSPAYSTLPPSPYMLCLTHPAVMHTTLCSPTFAWQFVHFFWKLLKASNSIFLSRKESLHKLIYCSVSWLELTTHLHKWRYENTLHTHLCLTLPRQEQHPPAPTATSHTTPPVTSSCGGKT